MKRSAIQRKTPMKPGKPMARGTSRMKSRGMKGAAPTVAELALHHDMAGLGCIACRIDGRINPWVSIHHIDGRTRHDAHKKALPLCAQHHQQDDTDPLGRIAVHPNKARFEERYGSQESLLGKVMAMLTAKELDEVKS